MIDADAQNLDVPFLKLGFLSLVRRNLTGSYRRPGFREESHHRDLSCLGKIAQPDFLLHMAFQNKIWCHIANIQLHAYSTNIIEFLQPYHIVLQNSNCPTIICDLYPSLIKGYNKKSLEDI